METATAQKSARPIDVGRLTSALLRRGMYRDIRRLSQYPLLATDDLGTEPKEVMHYGNVSSPMVRLIDKRYEEQLFTVISTNLTPRDITDVYGKRTSDRLAEMMQVLPFDNPSYRNTKMLAKTD